MVRVGLIMLMWLWMAPLWAADITARITPQKVPVNESFQLIVTAEGDLQAEPDWSVLKRNFEILSTSQSQQTNIINGVVSRERKWELALMAKHSGMLKIPPIPFGSERSPVLMVEVQKAEKIQDGVVNGNLQLELEVTPLKAVVQQQLLLTVRLWRRVNISNASLSEPELNGVEGVVERLGEDREYDKYSQGQRYKVIERRYAIFPQQSGTLTIEPIRFQGQIVERRSLFDPFGNSGRQVIRLSEGQTVEVAAMPPQAQGKSWLPSRKLQLLESWPQQPVEVKLGESFTRTIAVMADGLTAAQLPQIELQLPEGLRAYPDQPELKNQQSLTGITGIRQQKLALVAQRPGDYTLPPIQLAWWNVESGQMEQATLPARQLKVLPGGVSAAAPLQPADPAAVSQPVEQTPLLPLMTQVEAGYWPWISLALGSGWLLTLLYLLLRRPPAAIGQQKSVVAKPGKVIKALKQAAAQSRAQECKTLLLEWTTLQWPAEPVTSLSALVGRLPAGELQRAVQALNAALYRHSEAEWRGEALLQALASLPSAELAASSSQSPLAPLYPLR